jgi:transposase
MFVMSKYFSKDLRERVVAAYYNGVGTIPKIAKLFNLGKSTVDKYLSIHRSSGDLTPGKSTGRPTILDENHLSIIKEIVL